MNKGADSVLSVYSDARAEYTKQLCAFLVPAYFQFYIDLLEKAKQVMIQEPKRVLWQFQNYLNEIHDWNNEKVNNEIHIIFINSGCDYLEDLLTAVFIAHTKVLTAIRLSTTTKKIDIKIPKVEHFLFKALCETSKLLWSSTYLFRDGVPGIEKQQNYRTIEGLLNEGVIQAVRSLVPVKSILKDFMYGSDTTNDGVTEEDSDEDESDEKPIMPLEKKEDETQLSPDTNKPESINEANNPVIIEESQPAVTEPITLPSSPIQTPTPAPTPVQTPIISQPDVPQTINLDQKPSVHFGQFNAVFNLDEPQHSDMIHADLDDNVFDDEQIPEIEISSEAGIPLSESMDYEDLNASDTKQDAFSPDDYEEL